MSGRPLTQANRHVAAGTGPADRYIYDPPLLLFCDGRCCSGPNAPLTHTQITVTSICFRGPADAPKLERISALSG